MWGHLPERLFVKDNNKQNKENKTNMNMEENHLKSDRCETMWEGAMWIYYALSKTNRVN